MNQNPQIIQVLRNQLDEVRNDLRKYTNLYRNERDDRRQQEIHVQELRTEILNLLNSNRALRENLNSCQEHINGYKIPKPSKKWEDLQSPTSKAKR